MKYNYDFIIPHILKELSTVKKQKNVPIYKSRLNALIELSKKNQYTVTYIGEKPNGKLFNTQLMSNGALRIFISSGHGIHNYSHTCEININIQ